MAGNNIHQRVGDRAAGGGNTQTYTVTVTRLPGVFDLQLSTSVAALTVDGLTAMGNTCFALGLHAD